MDTGETKVITAIGHWDEGNAIFRCNRLSRLLLPPMQ